MFCLGQDNIFNHFAVIYTDILNIVHLCWPQNAPWKLGICNPSGLQGKHHILSSIDAGVVAVSETHLTKVSSSLLLQSLRSRSAYQYVVTGSPMCPRSTASEAGQYAGVAVVSKQPSRALCSAWPQDMYDTGRVQVDRKSVV